MLTKDMATIEGDLKSAVIGMKGITSLSIKDLSGEKLKFKAEDIHSLKVKVDNLAKLEMLAEKTSNLEKLFNADFNEVVDRKFAYYDQVQLPGKDRFVLVQLLNPGFDSKIKVYENPGAKTGETSVNGMAIKGDQAKAYFIVKNGEVKEISKNKYKKGQFEELFGDCPDLINYYSKPDFSDFAEHVLFYELKCR